MNPPRGVLGITIRISNVVAMAALLCVFTPRVVAAARTGHLELAVIGGAAILGGAIGVAAGLRSLLRLLR